MNPNLFSISELMQHLLSSTTLPHGAGPFLRS